MRTIAKDAIAFLLARLGYEIVRRPRPYVKVEPWFSQAEPIADEAIADGWKSQVLHLRNRHHRPPRLGYRRLRWGEDTRLKYICDFLDVRDRRVLELGPFEGYYSVLLDKLGASRTVAVEWKEDNYRKCLRVKEKYGLASTEVYRQDLEELYRGRERPRFEGQFDLVFCVGVLYHLGNPAWALEWMRTLAPSLFLGTQYFEPAAIERYRRHRFIEDYAVEHAGRSYRGWGMKRIEAPGSGSAPIGLWPLEADLLRMLEHAGYDRVEVLGKDLHNDVPHITILAEASDGARGTGARLGGA